MTASALRFQVGTRVLGAVPRTLARKSVRLAEVMAAELPVLPPLGDADGWLLTGLRAGHAKALRYLHPETACAVRQRYTRYFVDLTLGWKAYRARISGSTRAAIDRKTRKLARVSGGEVDIRRYRTPNEVSDFLPPAAGVSAKTYQEMRLDAGLPSDASFHAEAFRLAAADAFRGWLLFLDGAPIAYLCCLADGDSLRYSFVGHDPAHAALSSGIVLLAEAMRDLQSDRFRYFDFTEGESRHKRAFATGGIACADLLMLRRTLTNRAALTALTMFDGAVGLAKRALRRP